jgi:hypothetical protein
MDINPTIRCGGKERTARTVWLKGFMAITVIVCLSEKKIAEEFETILIAFDKNQVVIHQATGDLDVTFGIAGTNFVRGHLFFHSTTKTRGITLRCGRWPTQL